jgi:hypothetical protein
MTAEITTVIGQLSINEGKWRTHTPNQVAVREPKSADAPGAGKGDLFIITEIQGDVDDRDALEQRLAHLIRDSYYLSSGSVTASLRRAIQTGNDRLYQRNRKVSVDERIVGGAVALVVSQEDAFVAQIGPTALFAILGDHIRRYPARSIWLDETTEEDEDISGMGLNAVVEPNLHHLRVSPQDLVVLADSRLASRLSLPDVVGAVSEGDVKTTIKNLGDKAQTQYGSAIALQVIEVSSSSGGLVSSAKLNGLWQRRTAAEETAPVKESQVMPEPVEAQATLEPETERVHSSPVFASTSILHKPLEWFGSRHPKPDKEPAEAPETEGIYQGYTLKPEALPQTEPLEPVIRQATFNRFRSGSEATPIHHSPPPKKISRGLGTGLFMIIALLGGALRTMFNFVMPGSEQEPRRAGTQAQVHPQPRSAANWALLRNIAIAIPLLIGVIVLVTYLQKGRLREAEYNEFLATAQSKFEQAKVVDATAALSLMTEAEAALVQAEQIKPEPQPEITELRQQMAEETDRVGKVTRLYYLPQLRQYTDPGTNLESLVVQGVEIYVLDAGNDRIFHHRLDDAGEALLPDDESVLITARGQTVNETEVGELIDMTWMPTGGNRQTSDLLALSSTALLEYNPSWGTTTSALAGHDSLVLPAAVDSYFGNFYILDPQANALLRYLPTIDGYNGPPENYFVTTEPVNLANAVDLTIDGAIYVLYSEGVISKFLGGQPADFNVTGLDKPFNRPVAIFTAPDEEVQHIYVADAGNQRIVQLNKDGSFVRQFKPRVGEAVSFANLQDIFVDEISGRLYILDSNNLYLATLPGE